MSTEQQPAAAQAAPVENLAERDERFQIRVRDLHKHFGTQHVLRGVNLDIARGKVNVIIGGSGAGKSVILKHLIGLLKPDSGQIFVDGEDLVPLDDFQMYRIRTKFGMLFQYAALFDSMTVEENVVFPLLEHRRKQMTKAQMRELAREKLQSLGLFNIEKKFPAELSGGMRKRVGLARAIVLEPEMLFYDEPTTGLDPIATKNVDDMIAEISEQLKITSVVISHDIASTFRIGHQVAMLYKGQMIASGTPEEILRHPNEHLREFIATSNTVKLLPVAGSGEEER